MRYSEAHTGRIVVGPENGLSLPPVPLIHHLGRGDAAVAATGFSLLEP